AAARDILLVARHPIRRTHGAAFELAAGAIVVAHPGRALEAAGAARIGLPIESGREPGAAITGTGAQQLWGIETRRAHDAAGVEQARRIEPVLDLLESAREARPKHRL